MSREYTHVYIDESGETGRKSKYLVFASIETVSPRPLEKAIKRIWRAKPQLHAHGELHANAVDDATRVRVLRTIDEQKVKIRYCAIDKTEQSESLEVVYYKKLASFIGLHRAAKIFVVDKKDTDKKRHAMIERLLLQDAFTHVTFEESHRIKQLQATDFVAWSIGRYYETGDETFMQLLTRPIDVSAI